MQIGILGGTGPAGSALGLRLASIGCDVLLGSRDAQRAKGICVELVRKWPEFKLNLNGGDNDAAANCDHCQRAHFAVGRQNSGDDGKCISSGG